MKTFNITSPNKIIYPNQKITKFDVLTYYAKISNRMLPFVSNRLLSVLRCHNNILSKCFFKKHPTTDKKMVKIKKIKHNEYFFIENLNQLLYQVQMGSLEFHTWGSFANKIGSPNFMVFDLDPDTNLNKNNLKDACFKLKTILDELKLTSFIKTSGGKGFHIVVPFSECRSWKKFYEFSQMVSKLAENRWPNTFTTNIKKNNRHEKIFIDYLRNSRGATCIAPYSLRARDGASISFPISWQDLNNIDPNQINIENFEKYLNNSWNNFYKVNQKLK